MSLDYLVGSLPLPIADVSTPLVEKWRLRRGEGKWVGAGLQFVEGRGKGEGCTALARPGLPSPHVLC